MMLLLVYEMVKFLAVLMVLLVVWVLRVRLQITSRQVAIMRVFIGAFSFLTSRCQLSFQALLPKAEELGGVRSDLIRTGADKYPRQ